MYENYMELQNRLDIDIEGLGKILDEEKQNILNNDSLVDSSFCDDLLDDEIDEENNSHITGEYVYLNENSIPVFKIQEQDTGSPFLVQAYKNGKYEYGLNGTETIPYNVPDLVNGKKRVVFIVNGEDKADYLKSLGFIATTAPFNGATKWKENYNTYLQNASKVLILKDNSEKGKIFAVNTLKTVRKASNVKVSVISLKKIAEMFGIDLENESSLMKFKVILGDDNLLKDLLERLEKTVRENEDKVEL